MAESGEGTSISVNPKEKKSLLDKEIGKDFLSSWKSMSVTEDDTMDFNFDTVSNGKKKFNFDKLDMDFNLDGDFDKLSSFKVDMPELDFSCSSKKTAKTKERAEESSSSGNCEGKKDLFSFSFDFNDEDFTNDAQIGSKLVGNSMSLTKELTEAEHFSLRSEKNVNSPRNVRDGFNSDDEQNGSKLFGESSPQDKQVTQGVPDILVKKNAGEAIESDGAQSEGKVAAEAKLQDKQVAQEEPVMPGSEKDTGREGFDADFVQNGSKVVGNSRPQEKEATTGELVTTREKGSGLTEKTNKSTVEACGDPKFVVSSMQAIRDVKNDSFQGTKTSKRPHDLSTTIEKMSKSTANASENPKLAVSSMQAIWNVKNGSIEGTITGKQTPDISVSTEKMSKSSAEASGNTKFVVSSMHAIQNVKNDSIEGIKTGKVTPDLSGSTEKTSTSSAAASGNPKLVVSSMQSIQKVKDISADGIKTGKRTADLSSLKTLRTIGRNKEVPNTSLLGQSNSFRNLEQNSKLLSNMASNIPLSFGSTEKQKPLTTISLKRKKTEESNAELMSLKSLKCLSESPKESRYFKESSGRVIEGKVCNHGNQNTKNVLSDDSNSGLDSQVINMGALEISVGMENDRNVESAEAYTKELENICNMLKKKHEEAKELLVRAVVNNNNLLMLNHPMFEEKIHMGQKFAAQLTHKEVPN